MKRSLGLAFKDELARVTVKIGHFSPHGGSEGWKDNLIPNFNPDFKIDNRSPWRIVGILIFCIIAFFIFFIRLFHLQVVHGGDNRLLADGNRIQIKLIHAPRGVIFDRNGKVLASNEPGFRLLSQDKKVSYISRDEALKMEVSSDPKFHSLEIDNIRFYPYGEKLAHVLGYVSEVTDDELKNPSFSFKTGDKIGRGGVEETYQIYLRGVDGGEVIEVDSLGEKLRSLRKVEPIPGQNLYLTIDVDLQLKAVELLQESFKKSGSCCGAVIVEEPNTGEILALVSLPSFDPDKLSEYLDSPNSPILNRAIAGTYPPGSTFKIASSLAGLSSGKINSQTIFEDTGEIFLGPYKFSNWYFNQYGKVEGPVDLVKAIKRSNDTYFYRMSEMVGEKVLGEAAKNLRLGTTLGVDIPGEEIGLVPSPDWKEKNIGDVWFPGDTLHMAIGQGYVLVTPLQILNLSALIASDGRQTIPHLGLKITDSSGKLIKQFKFKETNVDFKKSDLAKVKEGMEQAAKAGGTAWPFFSFPIQTAGKTGTAEYGDPKNRTHAWYTAFAPADNPKIAVVVLIEGGGEGSSVAAPVAKEIFRWFLSEDKKNLIKDIYPIATESARQLGE